MIVNLKYFKKINGYKNYFINNSGIVYSLRFNKIKSVSLRSGYLTVNLKERGIQKSFSIHRLVAMCFLENTENKKEVNHKNGIKTDNRVENLEWCTKSENMIHSYRVLNNGYKEKVVLQLNINGEIINRFKRPIDASRKLNIDVSGITKCCRGIGKTYKNYKWEYEKK